MKGKGLVAALLSLTTAVVGLSVLVNIKGGLAPEVERARAPSEVIAKELAKPQALQEVPQDYIPAAQPNQVQPRSQDQAEQPKYQEVPGRTSYKPQDFSADKTLLAKLILGEARGESDFEKLCVGWTAITRISDGLPYNGEGSLESVAVPKGYNCFDPRSEVFPVIQNPEKYDPKTWKRCLEISEEILTGRLSDPTGGANLYFNPKKCSPYWQHEDNVKMLGHLKGPKGEKTVHSFGIETKPSRKKR